MLTDAVSIFVLHLLTFRCNPLEKWEWTEWGEESDRVLGVVRHSLVVYSLGSGTYRLLVAELELGFIWVSHCLHGKYISCGSWTGQCVRTKLLQSCPSICDPMEYSLPGSAVHGILQARILKWITMPSSRESSWSRDQTCPSSPTLAGMLFTTSTTSSVFVVTSWSPWLLSLILLVSSGFKIISGMIFTKLCQLAF